MIESVPWYYLLFGGILGISIVVGFVWKVIVYSAAGGFMGFLFAVGLPILKILIGIILFICMINFGAASLLFKIFLVIIMFILGIVLMFIWNI